MPEPHDARDTPALVVAGGSARGLAWSAWAAGWRVYAADCFGDADLDGCTAGHRVVTRGGDAAYPGGLIAAVATFPPAAWCYCGALENHPDVIARISAVRRLVGNPPATVARVRELRRLATLVRAAGLAWPETHDSPHGLPVDGTFLVKPLASAGGRGVMPWYGTTAGPLAEPHVWQRRIAGRSYGVSYALAAGSARLYGVARHLVRPTRRYAFHGAVEVDPLAMPTAMRRGLERFGQVLAAEGLVGMVGADVVIDGQATIHVVEVNPRPTSSMELVERGTGESFAAAHLSAVAGLAPAPRGSPPPGGTWAKLVVHARRRLVATSVGWSRLAAAWQDADGGWPAITDIPRSDAVVPAGAPLVTLFARGRGPRAAVAALRFRLAAFRGSSS